MDVALCTIPACVTAALPCFNVWHRHVMSEAAAQFQGEAARLGRWGSLSYQAREWNL